MADLTYSPPNPMAGILQGFAQSMQRSQQADLDERLKYRETILGQLDEIINNPGKWGPQSVEDAYQTKLRLMTTPPDKKWPTEWERGKNGEMPIGMEAIVRSGLSKELMKKGPKPPSEPPAPREPQDPGFESIGAVPPSGPPPVPQQPQMGAGGFADFMMQPPEAPPGMLAGNAGMPPIEGGAQLGPNQVSAAPAIPGQPMAEAAPVSAPPEVPWEVPQRGRLSASDAARYQAQLKSIETAIPDDLADALDIPKGSSLQGAREIRLREKEEVAANVAGATIELKNAQALREKAKAIREGGSLTELDRRKADSLDQQSDAAMLNAQARMIAASRPPSMGGGRYAGVPIVMKDDLERVTGQWDRSTNTFIAAPEGVVGARTKGVPYDERKSAANIDDMLDRQLPEIGKLATEFGSWLGPVSGRIMKAGTDWSSNMPEGMYRLIQMTKRITWQQLYEMSGKQINEAESKRLADIVSDVTQPKAKFLAAHQELAAQLAVVRWANATGMDRAELRMRLDAVKAQFAGTVPEVPKNTTTAPKTRLSSEEIMRALEEPN